MDLFLSFSDDKKLVDGDVEPNYESFLFLDLFNSS